MTKTYKIKPLLPGQEVAIPNCAETARVVRRVGNGKYLVRWKGHEFEQLRSNLAVMYRGRWTDGPVNTDQAVEAPAQ